MLPVMQKTLVKNARTTTGFTTEGFTTEDKHLIKRL